MIVNANEAGGDGNAPEDWLVCAFNLEKRGARWEARQGRPPALCLECGPLDHPSRLARTLANQSVLSAPMKESTIALN